jgi:hypothetical protein
MFHSSPARGGGSRRVTEGVGRQRCRLGESPLHHLLKKQMVPVPVTGRIRSDHVFGADQAIEGRFID